MKADTLPAAYQADLAPDSRKGLVNAAKDSGVAKLTDALSALSMEAAADGDSGEDAELCEVLTHLGITAGRPAPPAAVEAAQSWAELEEQEEISDTLRTDENDVLAERFSDSYSEEVNPSEDEIELNDMREVDSAGARGVMARPRYLELSLHFGPLEECAESCGMSEAAHYLRKAKMLFLAAHAAKPTRQADIRHMLSSG